MEYEGPATRYCRCFETCTAGKCRSDQELDRMTVPVAGRQLVE